MYKIEWKKQPGSVFNSCYIDGQICFTKALKFAQHANLLETKLKQLINDLPDSWNDYLNDLGVINLVEDKWITELEAELIIENKVILSDLISNGELGFTIVGDDRYFDRNDVNHLKQTLLL